MSLTADSKIICPACGTGLDIRKIKSYNYQEEGEDLQPVVSDAWISHVCPTCGTTIVVYDNMVFHDMEKKIMIFFFPNEAENEALHTDFVSHANLPADYSVRIVEKSYTAFKEKIMTVESGLDDIACEIYKLQVSERSIQEKSYKEREMRVVFDKQLKPVAIAVLNGTGKPDIVPFNNEDYQKALSLAHKIRLPEQTYIIDMAHIRTFLEEELNEII